MVNVSKFVREHIPLCVCTLGLAVLGYLGYHSVRWIINTCQRTKKVDQVAKKNIRNSSNQPSAHPSKPLVNRVKRGTPKTDGAVAEKKTDLPKKQISEKKYVELKTKLMANRKELIEKFPIMRFLYNQKELTEKVWLSNCELCGYSSLICMEHSKLYTEHSNLDQWDEWDLSNPELQNNFLKSNCRYLFTFVNVSCNHWTLLLVDKQQKTVEYYDSKHNYGGEDYKETIKGAKQVAKDFDYKFEEKIAKSIQPDGYQCGIWALYFLEERIKNPNISFNELPNPSKLIASFRKHVSNCLLIIDQVLKKI